MSILIGLAIAVPILLLRNARPRKLRLELLWVRPGLLLLAGLSSFLRTPPPVDPLSIAIMTAGFALGGALGWQRGRLMRIEVDPETHQMTLRASPGAMVFILVLMVLRMSASGTVLQTLGPSHVPATVIVDALILFSLGMFLVQSVEIGIRGRRLLAKAQAARAMAAE
jgi:hypothetical protein